MCGYKVPGNKFYLQRKLFCGNYIESQYYNHLGGKKPNNSIKGIRLVTGDICAMYYSFQYVFLGAETNRIGNIGLNITLLIGSD